MWGWGWGGESGGGTTERLCVSRFHCHFLPFSACLSQTEATADSWFSGGEKREKKPTDKHRLHYYMQMLFFPPFPFFFPFLCTLLEGASRALNMQLLCHYCQPGCLSANRRLNALPPPLPSHTPPPVPPRPPSSSSPSSHYRLSSRVPHADHRTGS